MGQIKSKQTDFRLEEDLKVQAEIITVAQIEQTTDLDHSFLSFQTIWNHAQKSLSEDQTTAQKYIKYLLSKYGGIEGLTQTVLPYICYENNNPRVSSKTDRMAQLSQFSLLLDIIGIDEQDPDSEESKQWKQRCAGYAANLIKQDQNVNDTQFEQFIDILSKKYSKAWIREMAYSEIMTLQQYEHRKIRTMFLGQQYTILQMAINENKYKYVWLLVEKYGYEVDAQPDPYTKTTLLHTVAKKREEFDQEEKNHVSRLIRESKSLVKKSKVAQKTFIETAVFERSRNLKFLVDETVKAQMPKIIFMRVKAFKKMGLHHNFYWPILQYITPDQESVEQFF